MSNTIQPRDLLRMARLKRRMSQCETAARVGTSQSRYCLIEKGYKTPSKEVAAKLIQLFNLPSGYFDQQKEA